MNRETAVEPQDRLGPLFTRGPARGRIVNRKVIPSPAVRGRAREGAPPPSPPPHRGGGNSKDPRVHAFSSESSECGPVGSDGGTASPLEWMPFPAAAVRKRFLASLLLPVLLVAGSLCAQAPEASQKTKAEVKGFSVPIEVREQYLGKSGERTVVRFSLSAPREELRKAGADRPRVFTFYIGGSVKDAGGKEVDTFRLPIEVDLTDEAAGKPLTASFLRALPAGKLTATLTLETVTGQSAGLRAITIEVPAMASEFVASDAGTGPGGLPTAAAVILESENLAPAARDGSLVKISAPKKEVPVGLIRVEAEVKPPVERVEFYLDDKKILAKNRPPYTVEVDLGTIPKRQTLKALGYDKRGNFIDVDAWAINERDSKLAVRLLDLPKKSDSGKIELKISVQSISGGVVKSVKLYADNDLLKEWTAPPYTATVSEKQIQRATLLRATAVDDEGKEFSDFKFLKGDGGFLSKIEINLVELNVSVFDKENHFVKELKKDDFEVLEDGLIQSVGSFEFAPNLPLSLGLIIDGSGSMKDAMPTVKQAALGFVSRLIGEKDQGFVIEFREAPTLLSPMTKSRADLQRAISEARAGGGTAMNDSIVMGLYQFRATPGRKALVVLTDGKDNHSWTDHDTLRRYARTAGIPIFIIGLDMSIFDMALKSKLKDLSADTGAEAFFIGKAAELDDIYKTIETELRSQYFMSYLTESKKKEDQFRTVEVRLKKPGLRAKTIRGYFP